MVKKQCVHTQTWGIFAALTTSSKKDKWVAISSDMLMTAELRSHRSQHHTRSSWECCQGRGSVDFLLAAGVFWINSPMAVSRSVRQFNCKLMLVMLTSSFISLFYFNLLLNRLLGFCSENQRCFPSAKPSHYHWPPPFLNLQHSHVCQESHWQEWGQQWAHHHYWWSRYAQVL